jgi:serine/threonine protein kinase
MKVDELPMVSDPEFDYLGPYRVEKILGRGGMGTVYKGVHAKSSEVVAIKVIASAVADQMRFRRRFEAEIQTLQKLKHPNIVSLKGVGEERGLLFYTMEYVDGQSLHEHLRQHRKLPWEDVVEVGVQTTAALKHAHDLGIIHRDLKPANLMLNSEGLIKLTDFGIAKLFGSADMTAAGAVIGTADYMPPEQAEGKGVTAKSDLYGLGGVLYALLSGKPPFHGKSVPEVLYAVRYNPVPDLANRVGDAPPALCELIHDLLEKSPSSRPPTALVVRNRLLSIQKGMQKISTSNARPSGDGDSATHKPAVGTQLTSLDLSDVDDEELKITNETHFTDDSLEAPMSADPSIDAAVGTHEQPTMLDPKEVGEFVPGDEEPTAFSDGEPGGARELDSPEKPVVDEEHKASVEAPESGRGQASPSRSGLLTSGGPSHYIPATEYEPTKASFEAELPRESSGVWIQYASFLGMAALLLGSLGFGWWMLQPRSADSIYESVMTAVDSGDEGQFLLAREDVEEFVERFPEDERQAELLSIRDEIELARWTRILRRRAARDGGGQALSIVEQGFLDCMNAREVGADGWIERMQAFLKVFAVGEGLDLGDQRLVDLVQFALESGQPARRDVSPGKLQMEEIVKQAEAKLDGDSLKTFYEDLVLLYGKKSWASEQVNRIKKKLETEF